MRAQKDAVAKESCTDFEPLQRRCATQIARMNVKIPAAKPGLVRKAKFVQSSASQAWTSCEATLLALRTDRTPHGDVHPKQKLGFSNQSGFSSAESLVG
jgi:hypothetical protein